jgi:hypothetical protein
MTLHVPYERMGGAWLTRLRWRRRGAWMWPAFGALTLLDAFVGHVLPPSGETQTLPAAAIAAIVLNLIALILLARPLGALLRRVREDLPRMVARDYAGTWVLLAVAAALLAAGVLHHSTITGHRAAMRDAIVRAQAFIGDRAPREFRVNVRFESTVTIEPGNIYRTCVPSVDRRRTYCVIVKTKLPLDRSVTFAGYESNSVFASGTG